MKISKFLSVVLTLAVAGAAQAQDQTVSASDETVGVGGSVTAVISLDSAAGDIQGWSWGVENDPAVATVSGVLDGSATATVGAGGGAPGFNTVNLFPNGWTVGVVIDFLGCCTLAPGTGLEMELPSYDAVGGAGDSTDLCFVDTLGSPPVATVCVIGGASIPPATVCGSITIEAGPPPFTYTAGSDTVTIPGPASDVSGIAITASIADTNPADDPSQTQGFSMGLSHTAEASVDSIAAVNDLAGLNGGTGPSFFGENLLPGGWTVGVVYNFLGGVFLDFSVDNGDVIEASYSATGVSDGDVTALAWTDTLGSPPVANVVVVGGASIAAGFADGAITYQEVVAFPYIRADCNDDSIVNIADGIWILNELFQGGPASPCSAACDANDDSLVDAADATYIFNYRFLGGAPPSAPFPDCGGDSMDPGCDPCP